MLLGIAQAVLDEAEAQSKPKTTRDYRVNCPQCGRPVIKTTLFTNGCYLCGWQPATAPLPEE